MKRVIVRYGGELFSTAGKEIADLEEEIAEAVATGQPVWMTLNSGDGRYSEARVLIAPGIPISLSAVTVDDHQEASSGPLGVHEINPTEIDSNREGGT